MSHKKQMAAGLLCAVLVLAMLVSSALILHEAGHDCTGEDCPVCQAILMNSRLLRLIGTAVLMLSFLPGMLRAERAWTEALRFSVPVSGTLVSLKIRLNN